jgi:hypothetical protein
MSRNTIGFRWWGQLGAGVGAGLRARRGDRKRLRPVLLALEERRLLATFTVVNTNDSGKGSLRAAVDLAIANQGSNTINFSPFFNAPQTISLTSGQLVLNDSGLSIAGPAAGVTVSGGGLSRVFQVNQNMVTSISDLTITGGGGSADRGGGVLSLGGTTLTLTNCTVSGNAAGTNGGGLANYGNVTLTNCTVSSNTAGISGGALFDSGTMTVSNCVVSGNSAKSGGGLFSKSGTTIIESSSITNDVASKDGGGFYNNAAADVTSSTFTNDSAGNGHSGGGVYNNAIIYLTDSVMSDDKAGGYAGGLYNNWRATLIDCTLNQDSSGSSYYGGGLSNKNRLNLINCTVSNNSAGRYGGGLYNDGPVDIINSTFSGNSAGPGYYGGGMYDGGDGSGTLMSCTFSDNSATFGGGVYAGPLNIINTIVAGNSAPGGSPDIYGIFISWGHNLIGNTQGSKGFGGNGDITGRSALLAPLAFYGGPTQTMALLPGSPAIRAGTESSEPIEIKADQRGFALDSPPDIGAFQVQSSALLVNTTADGSRVPYGKLDLRGAVNLAGVLSGGQTISFDPSVFARAQTITLTSGQLELKNTSGTQTIAGPAAGLTVSSGGHTRVFQVDAGVTASISGLTITGGNADAGGGLLNRGNLNVTNCIISSNSASNNISGGVGGGVFNDSKITMTRCNIVSNTSGSSGGGVDNNGTMTMTQCTVSGNTAYSSGGGVWNDPSGDSSLTNCTFTGDTAKDFGGGAGNDLGKETLTNCTFRDNTANGGGGLYNKGAMSLVSSTLTANSGVAKGGGGLFNDSGPSTLTDTIVAGNTNGSARRGASDIGGGADVSGTFNLIGIGGSGGLASGVSGNKVGVVSPGLANLAFYGGPTQTIALLPGSPAIGSGTRVSGVTTDQRGFALDSPPDIGAFQVQSTPLVVNTTADGSAVAPGALDLRGAVDLTDALPGGQTISFDPKVFATAQKITLTAGQLDLSNIGGSDTITGPAVGVTISGGGNSRVFQIEGWVTASISGLTLAGGSADRGGGLLNSGNVTLTNCTISGSTASKNGAGLANYGTVTLTNCTISGNTAPSGGGLANFGRATLSTCTISNNSAFNSGGVLSNGTMSLTNCTVRANTASTQNGGGLLSNGTTTLTNCTLSGNSAGTNGGGLANYGTVTMINCTVSGNSARVQGGGVQNPASGRSVLSNCTVSANTAHQGGGLFNLGKAILIDTIVAVNLNGAKSPGASDIAGTVDVSSELNLIGTGGSGGLVNGVFGNIVGVADPHLGALAPYGGPTQTMALMPGSPAIGKARSLVGVTTDQRGLPRGASVDIGAYQTSLVVTSTAGPVNTDPAQLTLAGAVSLANAFAGPVAITFDPAVFTRGQTITLTAGQLELQNNVLICTITGPAAGVTISAGNSSQVFQVDKGVRAYLSGLTVTAAGSSTGLEDLGMANVTKCVFIGTRRSSLFGIDVSGGTLAVSQSTIAGWFEGIQVLNNATATITASTISGNGAGIQVGASSFDTSAVTVQRDDLSDNQQGVFNFASRPVDATYNWWGKSAGPGATGASPTVGNVVFSPWLGDILSRTLDTPRSLGFASDAGNSYVVTANPSGPNLRISLNGNPNPPWTVTPTGTILFVGNGGSVTVSGQPGTDAFTIDNAAITFTSLDVFNGATIQFNGNIGREIDAKGTNNSFDVSGWTGTGTLAAPLAAGTVSTVVASKYAGCTMTNTSLSSPDGMKLTLRGVTTANLTAMATSGKPPVIVDASAFSGVTNLTVAGTGNAILFGGSAGNNKPSTLTATGSGNDILIGGPGANTLTDNGTGCNVLIGGGGPNTITGNGNDILISGTSVYSLNSTVNIAALDAILAEWCSTDAYTTRIQKIMGGMIPGGYALNAGTVNSNGRANTVSDGTQPSQQNWFIITRNDTVSAKGTETHTIIPS